MRTYSAMPHLNGNLLCALDLETTGTDPHWHEPVQIAVVPLNSDIRPLEGVTPFYTNIKPLHPERAQRQANGVHGLDLEDLMLYAPSRDKVADTLLEWFERLALPFERSIIPMAHKYPFEHSFMIRWLGAALYEKMFHAWYRDAMTIALGINDRAFMRGEKAPFNKVNLKSLCAHFGVVNQNPHDAYSDCIAETEVYRGLLHYYDV